MIRIGRRCGDLDRRSRLLARRRRGPRLIAWMGNSREAGGRGRAVTSRKLKQIETFPHGFNKSHSLTTRSLVHTACSDALPLISWRRVVVRRLATPPTSSVHQRARSARAGARSRPRDYPPDVNESTKFTVTARPRFGSGGRIRNVGRTAIDSIINARKKDGPYALCAIS